MGIKNKPLFAIGLSFQIFQAVMFVMILLSLLNWDWLTSKIIEMAILAVVFLVYNIVSIVLMFSSLD